MKKHFSFFIIGLLISSDISGQLIVNTGMTPTQLVQNVLVGSGVTVSNVTYTGGASALGSFSNGNTTNLGLTSGVVMCSGQISDIPQAVGNVASIDLGLPGDPDLDALTSNSSFDAAVLAFDFVPLSDTIKFRYVFGSEEYPEYVGSAYNDVFGFFISGPNPAGGSYSSLNIARIPGTVLPVTINNVNAGSYSTYFIDNEGLGGTTIVYDGFTTVLTAWCLVTACQNYHIKLAVGDIADHILDSGVFLEANSFSTNSVAAVTTFSSPGVSATSAIEGCNNATVTINLASPASVPTTINWTIGGTATNGVDYNTIGTSLVIPTGSSSGTIQIVPIADGIPEGTETVILTISALVCGQPLVVTVPIEDNSPLTALCSPDVTICAGSTNLSVTPSGGYGTYTYNWSNGAGTSSSATVSPIVQTTYTVTVSDQCGATATDDVTVFFGSLTTSAGNDVTICNGQSTTLTATNGGTYNWSNGGTTASITVSPTTTSTYLVTVTTNGCTATDDVVVTVNPNPTPTTTETDATCSNNNGTATANPAGLTYNWSNGQNTQTISNLSPGNYLITVTDANGCSATASALVGSTDDIILNTSSTDETCGHSDATANITATGGLGGGNYNYLWSNGLTTSSISGLSAGTYTVTVDDGVCNATATVTIINDPGPVAGFSVSPTIASIESPLFTFNDNSTNNPVSWTWDFGDGTTGSGTSLTHTYDAVGSFIVTLIVMDANGCIDSIQEVVTVKDIYTFYIPNTFTPNGDGHNDVFGPTGINLDLSNFEMYIFDRWGKMVYKTTDLSKPWNGCVHNLNETNEPVMGVYSYKILMKENDGPKHEYIGRITLIP